MPFFEEDLSLLLNLDRDDTNHQSGITSAQMMIALIRRIQKFLLFTFRRRRRKLWIFSIKFFRDFVIHYYRLLDLVPDTNPVLISSRARNVPITSEQFQFLGI